MAKASRLLLGPDGWWKVGVPSSSKINAVWMRRLDQLPKRVKLPLSLSPAQMDAQFTGGGGVAR